MKVLLFVLALAVPFASSAQNAPDYTGYSKKLNGAHEFLASKEYCEAAGYTVDPDSFKIIMPPIVVEAVNGGMPSETAIQMVSMEAKKVGDANKLVHDSYTSRLLGAFQAKDTDAAAKVAVEYFNYIDTKCANFATEPRFIAAIKSPAASVKDVNFRKFLSWLSGRLGVGGETKAR